MHQHTQISRVITPDPNLKPQTSLLWGIRAFLRLHTHYGSLYFFFEYVFDTHHKSSTFFRKFLGVLGVEIKQIRTPLFKYFFKIHLCLANYGQWKVLAENFRIIWFNEYIEKYSNYALYPRFICRYTQNRQGFPKTGTVGHKSH